MTEFHPLPKKRIKELEIETTHYLNILTNDRVYDPNSRVVDDFHNWSNDADGENNVIFFKGLYEKVNLISNKLGFKQAYYANYEGRNAVWGFEYNSNEYIMYFSNLGLGLQMLGTVSAKEVLAVMNEIIMKWKA